MEYNQGYDEMMDYIKSNGWITARNMFNEKYPVNNPPKYTISEYLFAKGEINALLDTIK